MGRRYTECPDCAYLRRRLARIHRRAIINAFVPWAGVVTGVIIYQAIR